MAKKVGKFLFFTAAAAAGVAAYQYFQKKNKEQCPVGDLDETEDEFDAQEASVEDAPAEDAPAEEAPAEEAPVEDAPAEEPSEVAGEVEEFFS